MTRTGRILKVLSTPEETPRPPKILYECLDQKKRRTKQYVNNPSMRRVVSEDEAAAEEEEGGEEGEGGELGEGQANY